ncbi:guanine deaminase [Ramaria rubella]|nr:guanine deaminase [Ramaria rubella]
MHPKLIYRGPIIHSLTSTHAEILEKATVVVSEGVIRSISKSDSDVQVGCDDTIIEAREGEWLMPGFIDTHTHACQFPILAVGEGYELLDWLKNVVFPTEKKFSDEEFAKEVYPVVVKKLLSFGTTTCCYYGSLHFDATKILVDEVKESGQRAFVGKCNMDVNDDYPSYKEPSAQVSLEDTKKLIHYIRGGSHDSRALVDAVISPRFALSCSDKLLTDLGKLATQIHPPVPIQTHLSENKGEVRAVLKRFPDCPSYTAVYDHFGLLREGTILGHCCWLDDGELELIKKKGACVSHCPTSNFNLRSGIARVAEMLQRGIKVGLGTDVSGGFSPSMLNAIRNANVASKVLEFRPSSPEVVPRPSLSQAQLLYLATLGGAIVCGLSKKVGNFVVGKEFDALFVSVGADAGNPAVWSPGSVETQKDLDTPEERLKKGLDRFFYGGDEKNIKKVWVRGRLVKEN